MNAPRPKDKDYSFKMSIRLTTYCVCESTHKQKENMQIFLKHKIKDKYMMVVLA